MARVSSLEFTQRKNLSFAISTLNDPDFLFLDDPTSSTDPYFKYQIWKKIKNLIKENNTTVFLTTSDSNECENADLIGYLREGKIILEDSPNNLLTKYFVNSMEKVFFCVTMQLGEPLRESSVKVTNDVSSNLSRRTSETSLVSGGFTVTNEDVLYNEPTKKIPNIHNKEIFDYSQKRRNSKFEPPSTTFPNRVLYLFEKEFIGFIRNYQKIFAYLLLPVICILLFFYTVGGQLTGLKLGIVNLETNLCSEKNQTEFLSCEIIGLIDQNNIKIIFFKNQESARDSAYNGNIDGILILAKFMTDIMNSVGSQQQSHQRFIPAPKKY